MAEDTLYHIDRRIADALQQHADLETGEIPDAALDALDALYEQREAKLLAYGHVVLWQRHRAERIDGEAKAYYAEYQRLKRRQQVALNLAERLRARAEAFMDPSEKIADDTVTLGFRKQPDRIDVDPEAPVNDWPAWARRSEPSKSALMEKARSGAELPDGARLVQGVPKLQVRR